MKFFVSVVILSNFKHTLREDLVFGFDLDPDEDIDLTEGFDFYLY